MFKIAVSIYNFLTEYANKNPSRWHTPGHSGFLERLDITELVLDGELEKLIQNAQSMAAKAYGVEKLRFLTNGSSIGIKACIAATGGDILCFSGCHQAIKEGAVLAKVNAFKFDTGLDNNGLPSVVTVEAVKKALKKHSQVKAVYIESPDYYGRIVSKEVVDAIRNAGKLAFVDAAHGAHFAFSKDLKKLCLAFYADAANLSAHKTLNAYTQTAYLAINNKFLFEPINTALINLGTTSPNYLLLASLETAIETAKKADYSRLKKDCLAFKEKIPCLKNEDFTRLVVDTKGLNITSEVLTKALINNSTPIYAEKVTDRYIVFIATPQKTARDFKQLENLILSVRFA